MGYYMVRMTNTATREFVVKAESKDEAIVLAESTMLALKYQKIADENKLKLTEIRKTQDESCISTEVCETGAEAWTAAAKTKRK